MINIYKDIVSSLLASLTAIYGLNFLYHRDTELRSILGSYRNRIIYTPLLYVGLTLSISKILDSILDEDAKIRSYLPYIQGFLVGIVLTFIGIKYWKLDQILPISNPLMLYAYISIAYSFFYGFVI